MPTARDFCASRMIASSTACGETIIRSASSSITTRRYGSGSSPRARNVRFASGRFRARMMRQALVAALHLGDDVLEHRRGLLRARDDGRQEVRDRLVEVELDPLRVDEDHPHVVRRRAQQHRREQRVDAARLPRARGAGDQEVRHPREVGPDRVARDVLAEPDGERARRPRKVVEDVAERDHARREVRDLDPDGLLARGSAPGSGSRSSPARTTGRP